MVTTIFSGEFWKGLNYAKNYESKSQCKLDYWCRVVHNDGDSIYDVCRRCGSAKEFIDTMRGVVMAAYRMGVAYDRQMSWVNEYIVKWEEVLPTSRLGWMIVKWYMNRAESRKKKWVEEKNRV